VVFTLFLYEAQAVKAQLVSRTGNSTNLVSEKVIPIGPGQQLLYEATWMGVPVASAKLKFEQQSKGKVSIWRAIAQLRTHPVLDPVFRLRDSLCENFDSYTLAPQEMVISQHENRTKNQYFVRFGPQPGHIETVQKSPRGIRRRHFWLNNAFGPFSGALTLLSQPLSVGDRRRVLVFTGTAYYTVEIAVEGEEPVVCLFGKVRALRLAPKIVAASDPSVTRAASRVTIWVSAREPRIPVRIEAQSYVGPIQAELVTLNESTTRLRRTPQSRSVCPQLAESEPALDEQSGLAPENLGFLGL